MKKNSRGTIRDDLQLNRQSGSSVPRGWSEMVCLRLLKFPSYRVQANPRRTPPPGGLKNDDSERFTSHSRGSEAGVLLVGEMGREQRKGSREAEKRRAPEASRCGQRETRHGDTAEKTSCERFARKKTLPSRGKIRDAAASALQKSRKLPSRVDEKNRKGHAGWGWM